MQKFKTGLARNGIVDSTEWKVIAGTKPSRFLKPGRFGDSLPLFWFTPKNGSKQSSCDHKCGLNRI
jgi:hypothetical protein